MRNITKEFPGVKALDDVSLKIRRGELHALIGENGAGKSTLMKVLSGVYPDKSFKGQIFINGKESRFHTTRDSEHAGVAIIYQELALIKDLNIAENIFLGKLHHKNGVVDWDRVYFEAGKLLDEIGIKLDLSKKINDIGIGQQQLVEIAKALSVKTKLLILDEPTAALTESEVALLMQILRKLKTNGVTCILISHKLNEVMAIADRVTVLRDGATVGTNDIEDLDENKIIKMMAGRELTQRYPDKYAQIGDVVFEVRNYTKYSTDERKKAIVRGISLKVRHGEILGISGLMGAGRTELIMSLFGHLKGVAEGELILNGRQIHIRNPKDAIDHGIGMVTEDRKKLGLVLIQSVVNNSTLASLDHVSNLGILNLDEEVHETNHYIKELMIKCASGEVRVETLSGGNQQKVLLARCLMTKPKLIFLDEPTRGIDVGAKYEIYTLINKLASQGTAIIMVSSEMPEILGMSDRIMVMHEGEIAGELSQKEATQEKIMELASGGKNET